MKKIALTLVLFTFLVTSCKDTIQENEPKISNTINENLDISQAKKWFENDFLLLNKKSKANANGKKYKHKTNWEKAFKGKFTNDDDIIIVPIETKIDNKFGNQNSYLWVYSDKNKKNKVLIVDYSGKKTASANQVNLNIFSGLMTFREFNGELINSFVFENGEAKTMAWSIDGEETELQKTNKKLRISNSCYNIVNASIICIDYSWISCVSTNLGQTYYCQWSYDFQVCTLNAGGIIDVACGYSTTTNTNSNPTTGSTPSSANSNSMSVTNALVNPCFRSGLDNIRNSQAVNNKIIDILRSFDNSSSINLTFDEKVLSCSLDGQTSGNTISLNSTGLSNASKEYIAATLIHEILHKYLNTLNGVTDHNIMAFKYIYPMRDALLVLFPNMSSLDAEDLAWGGLQQTQIWQNIMSSWSKDRILKTNVDYKRQNCGFGTYQPITKGTNC